MPRVSPRTPVSAQRLLWVAAVVVLVALNWPTSLAASPPAAGVAPVGTTALGGPLAGAGGSHGAAHPEGRAAPAASATSQFLRPVT